MQDRSKILEAFGYSGKARIRPLGRGNINSTFLVEEGARRFVLQKINGEVFPSPEAVAGNFPVVTEHIRSGALSAGNRMIVAAPVQGQGGAPFIRDSEGGVWRGQQYVDSVYTPHLVSLSQAESVGRTLGSFHSLLEDLSLERITDPLPCFHHLSTYLNGYDGCDHSLKSGDPETFHLCLETIASHRKTALRLEDACMPGEIKLQPIHGDPKVDNFIFDDCGEAVGMLDLDTVGGGIIFHDLGDCLRSSCNSGGESAGYGEVPTFDEKLASAILQGYLACNAQALGEEGSGFIYDGLVAICFELGVRFFTDHLRGNVYFRVRQENENLRRARIQLLLCRDVLRREDELRGIIARLHTKSRQKK